MSDPTEIEELSDADVERLADRMTERVAKLLFHRVMRRLAAVSRVPETVDPKRSAPRVKASAEAFEKIRMRRAKRGVY
jgi:hypothetical protein